MSMLSSVLRLHSYRYMMALSNRPSGITGGGYSGIRGETYLVLPTMVRILIL